MGPPGTHHHDPAGHRHGEGHGHHHGFVDPEIAATARGLHALKISFAVLVVTAALQAMVVVLSGSVALLADTIHNVADAATALPLAVAFWLGRRPATRRFTYGLGRVEDFAGLLIVAIILLSALVAGQQAVARLIRPAPVEHLGAVVAASVIGFVGNEAVAIFRIRVGRQIGSVALVADGHHARVDGWTSLAVLAGALGVWVGYPLADPIVGLLIAAAILVLVAQAGREVVVRMLDGVEPGTLEALRHAANHVPAVAEVTDVRARWSGHRLDVDLSIAVAGAMSVEAGHEVAREVRHQLLHHVPHVGRILVHVDPVGQGGEHHHRIGEHAHDGLPVHVHD
jgi:cation diffusion facilitator family transporter